MLKLMWMGKLVSRCSRAGGAVQYLEWDIVLVELLIVYQHCRFRIRVEVRVKVG